MKVAVLIQEYAKKDEYINLLVEKRDGSQKNVSLRPVQNKRGPLYDWFICR